MDQPDLQPGSRARAHLSSFVDFARKRRPALLVGAGVVVLGVVGVVAVPGGSASTGSDAASDASPRATSAQDAPKDHSEITLIDPALVEGLVAPVEEVEGDAERIVRNERAAAALLRTIASAQMQVVLSTAIDTDGDYVGEYAFLGELAGKARLRTAGDDGITLADTTLEPAILDASFGQLTAGEHGGVVERNGYVFQVWLPGPGSSTRVQAMSEARGVGGCSTDGPFPDTDASETAWAAYAWPKEAGTSGQRTFFFNQKGTLLEFANANHRYDGATQGPAFDAALATSSPSDMLAPLSSDTSPANDGNLWTPSKL